MCGIWGLIDAGMPHELREQIAGRAIRSMAHRGPDDEGVWTDGNHGVTLAHNRLAIQDLSSAGHQPMVSASGRYTIVFNGEVYNFLDLRKEIEEIGSAPVWRGGSDTEVILAAIELWGFEMAVGRLSGMFAIGAWDRIERTLWLARDRLGEKPLFFSQQQDRFAFSSELKALRELRWPCASLDTSALGSFARFGWIPAPRTICHETKKLPPAHLLRVSVGNDGRLAQRSPWPYWNVAEVCARGQAHPFQGSDNDANNELGHRLRRSVRNRLIADVPLGAFLSGGIDSSCIVALMQEISSRPIRTFTIGFHEARFNEADQAKLVAAHLGTEHTELTVTERDARDVIPLIPQMVDEPFGDSSLIPTFLISRLAKPHVTVALSGDGGDELFAGYNRYRVLERRWQAIGRIPFTVRKSFAPLLYQANTTWPRRLLRFVGRNPDSFHALAQIMSSRDIQSFYTRSLDILKFQEPLLRQEPDCAAEAEWPPWSSASFDGLRQMMFMDLVEYLPDDILMKVDRASMAVSLETRIPLLDHAVVEFAWSLPERLLRRGGQTKWLLRRLLKGYLPQPLVDHPKHGFAVPLSAWLRGPLKDWVEAELSIDRLKQQPWFCEKPLRRLLDEHLAGVDRGAALWNILIALSCLRRFFG